MKELKVGMYVRTEKGIIFKYYPCKNTEYDKESNIYHEWDDWGEYDDYYIITKANENIIDLIEPMDLLFVDIDNGYEGGIIVPRIAETMSELNEIKEKIKSGNLKLKYIVTKEEIECRKYEVK